MVGIKQAIIVAAAASAVIASPADLQRRTCTPITPMFCPGGEYKGPEGGATVEGGMSLGGQGAGGAPPFPFPAPQGPPEGETEAGAEMSGHGGLGGFPAPPSAPSIGLPSFPSVSLPDLGSLPLPTGGLELPSLGLPALGGASASLSIEAPGVTASASAGGDMGGMEGMGDMSMSASATLGGAESEGDSTIEATATATATETASPSESLADAVTATVTPVPSAKASASASKPLQFEGAAGRVAAGSAKVFAQAVAVVAAGAMLVRL